MRMFAKVYFKIMSWINSHVRCVGRSGVINSWLPNVIRKQIKRKNQPVCSLLYSFPVSCMLACLQPSVAPGRNMMHFCEKAVPLRLSDTSLQATDLEKHIFSAIFQLPQEIPWNFCTHLDGYMRSFPWSNNHRAWPSDLVWSFAMLAANARPALCTSWARWTSF